MNDCIPVTDYRPVNTRSNINPLILGLARLLDWTMLLNKPGNKSNTEIDKEAIKNDWEAVGKDLSFAIIDHGKKQS